MGLIAEGDQNGDDEEDDERNLGQNDDDGRGAQSNRYLQDHDSSMMDSDPNVNKSRYEDYDNRPIKPLDTNLFEKQLSEYTEMSTEEMELLKKK